MGKVSIITREQKIILDEVSKSSFLKDEFYFTGGTALSEYHLQHRHSEDLDFFTERALDKEVIFSLVEEWSKKHKFTFTSRFVEVVYIFMLTFPNKEVLKVDFAHYNHKRLQKGTFYDGITVDSLLDIAVNKFLTISQRTEIKDFVDLYFLLKTFSLWDLREGLRVKFRMHQDPLLIASDLLKVEDFDTMPRMVKPLSLDTLKDFFREKAKELGRKAVE